MEATLERIRGLEQIYIKGYEMADVSDGVVHVFAYLRFCSWS